MESFLLYLLAASVVVQVAYALYYFLPLALFKPRTKEQQQPVSVIVCAHNEIENLQHLIPALLEQDYPQYELVLVNDRSTDGTSRYFEEVAYDFPDTKLVKIKETPVGFSPKKYALTLGIRASKYEHLLLTDADCVPASRNWISEMQRGFLSGTSIVLGFSPYKARKGFLNRLIRFETLLSAIQYLSFALKGQPYMGVGRNLSYTKTCFLQNKGFATHIKLLGGDDDLFVQEAGNKQNVNIIIDKEAQTISEPKTTYSAWVRQKRRHLGVGKQYKLSDKIKLGLFVLANLLFYVTSVAALTIYSDVSIVVGLIVVRFVAVFTIYFMAARRLQEELSLWLLPVLDIIYWANYLFLGVSVALNKQIRWK